MGIRMNAKMVMAAHYIGIIVIIKKNGLNTHFLWCLEGDAIIQ